MRKRAVGRSREVGNKKGREGEGKGGWEGKWGEREEKLYKCAS